MKERTASSDELADLVRAFVQQQILPIEQRWLESGDAVDEALRTELQHLARQAGLLAPQVPPEWGGLGLNQLARAKVFIAAGYSILGPLALNIAAPDEGNMHLLEAVATDEQKKRYLRPLAAGEIRSAFAMTEPAPGAGSDPAALHTEAHPVDGQWVINGRKWFITGADGAAVTIVMARTGGSAAGPEATMFMVPADHPGMRIVRHMRTLDSAFAGGHCEVEFHDCAVHPESVLGEVGRGFQHAQVRLAPARLSHCMRWLGLAQRAQDIAADHVQHRSVFGAALAEHGMIQQQLADSEIDLEASRGLIDRAAIALDQGLPGRHETSVAKVFVAEAVVRIIDRSIQMCGGLGVSADLPLAQFLREVRPFRIYDGPSEVHRMSIARRVVRRRSGS
jgi:acyl-CoA dehydrogenase